MIKAVLLIILGIAIAVALFTFFPDAWNNVVSFFQSIFKSIDLGNKVSNLTS